MSVPQTQPTTDMANEVQPHKKYYRCSSKRIFVNRSLSLDKIKFFGFDMDYTLAEYKEPEYQIMGFKMLQERLVTMGYPEQLMDFEYDVTFPIRGLWFDTVFGNLLKVDAHGNILYCAHGFQFLNSTSISERYPNKFIQLEDSRIYVLNTLFNLPETYMLACIIDFFNNSGEYTTMAQGFRLGDLMMSYKSIFQDIRNAVDYLHMHGNLKRNTVDNLQMYVKRDPDLPLLLRRLQSSGRKTFLLTNSEWWYTDKVMSFLLENEEGESWCKFFNFVFVDACKPLFFGAGTVLRQVEQATGKFRLGHHTGSILEHAVYSGGSCDVLSKMIGAKGKDVLYFGDHIFGDVLKSKKLRGWRTYLVIPELSHELSVWTTKTHTSLFSQLEMLDGKLSKIYKNLDSSNVEKPDVSAVKSNIQLLIHNINMSYGLFGSMFRSGSRQTFFSSQVARYSDLYASSIMNLLSYPFSYMFRAPTVLLPHESTTTLSSSGHDTHPNNTAVDPETITNEKSSFSSSSTHSGGQAAKVVGTREDPSSSLLASTTPTITPSSLSPSAHRKSMIVREDSRIPCTASEGPCAETVNFELDDEPEDDSSQ